MDWSTSVDAQETGLRRCDGWNGKHDEEKNRGKYEPGKKIINDKSVSIEQLIINLSGREAECICVMVMPLSPLGA